MGGPYLESGESIVLTTDRVSIDAVMYQAMLTTRRLILIDSRNARFDPQGVTLSAIQTVRSGKAATGEPVIILTLQERESAGTTQRVIIFSQEPAENRKPDRDLWLKTFIELSVSGRETENIPPAPAGEVRGGIHPTIRRWVAPDISRPRSENFPVKEPAPEITISVDEPEPVTIAGMASTPVVAPAPDDDGQVADRGQGYQDSLVRATRTAVQSLAGPEPEGTVSPPPQEEPGHEIPAPAHDSPPPGVPDFTGPDTTSPLSVSILAAVQSLTGSKQQDPPEPGSDPNGNESPAPDDFSGLPYEKTVRSTSQLPDDLELHPVTKTPEKPDFRSPVQESDPPDIMPVNELPAPGIRNTSRIPESPLPAPEVPEPSFPEREVPEPLPSPPETKPGGPYVTPEPLMDESASQTHVQRLEEVTGKHDDSPEARPVPPALPSNAPIPPASGGYHVLLAGGIILCLLLVFAGVLLLPGTLPRDSGQDIVNPVPVTNPAIVLTPPASTPALPANGTWVRIVSPAYFLGLAGNPDSLQQVSGSGEKWFRMQKSTGLVKVSVEKQEDSGDELRVEVYSEGQRITSRATSAPHGTVDLLIDPATGEAPGMTETPNPARTGSGRLDYL